MLRCYCSCYLRVSFALTEAVRWWVGSAGSPRSDPYTTARVGTHSCAAVTHPHSRKLNTSTRSRRPVSRVEYSDPYNLMVRITSQAGYDAAKLCKEEDTSTLSLYITTKASTPRSVTKRSGSFSGSSRSLTPRQGYVRTGCCFCDSACWFTCQSRLAVAFGCTHLLPTYM